MMGPGRDSIASILSNVLHVEGNWYLGGALGVLLEPGRTGEGRRGRP